MTPVSATLAEPATVGVKHHARRGALLQAALMMWLLAACNVPAEGPNLAQPITELLPSEWRRVGGWHNINLDADPEPEYLLFHTYNGVAVPGSNQAQVGPIGALILDTIQPLEATSAEASTPITATVTAESRIITADELIYHRVLPGYWAGQGQGFIAAPGEEATISVHQLESTVDGAGESNPLKEVLILAGGSRMTVIWHRGANLGYGVTQLQGSGGIFHSIEGASTTNIVEPVVTVWADTPLNDRNLLCLRSRYDRMIMLSNNVEAPFANNDAISYVETPLGITFCHGAPSHPFYPEGVVLAYLQNPQAQQHLLFPTLDEEKKSEIANLVQNLRSGDAAPRVDALLGYKWWPQTPIEGDTIETTVCATIQGPNGPQSLLFILIYAIEMEENIAMDSDRLYIQDVNPILAPAGAAADCRTIIGSSTSEQRATP